MPTIVVETGAGVPGANSWVSRTTADTYHKDRGNTAWAAAGGSERDTALILGAQFMGASYKWAGSKTDRDNPMDWPRIGAVDDEGLQRDSDSIPVEIQHAQMEFALLALAGPLLPPLDRGGFIKKVEAGPVAVEWDGGAPAGRSFEYIERILDPLTEGRVGGSTVTIYRA